jgi:hypothetical protein
MAFATRWARRTAPVVFALLACAAPVDADDGSNLTVAEKEDFLRMRP